MSGVIVQLIVRCSTNPGSVWFPEVSQTRCNFTEFLGQTALNSNFLCLSALFRFTADKQSGFLLCFGCFQKDSKGTATNVSF